MKVEFGDVKGVECMKVWDAEGNICRFDGDGLEWLRAQIASKKDGVYEPEPVKEAKSEPVVEEKRPAPKKKAKKKGILG